MAPILGIDISRHQGWQKGVPFKMLAALGDAGVRYVIARASIGTLPDPHYRAHAKRVANARPDWVFGAYHFLDDGPEGDAQAETFVAECRAAVGPQDLDGLITVLDVERSRKEGSTNFPTWRQAKAFAQRFRQLVPGHPLGLYSNEDTIAGALGNPDAATVFDWLWQARWTMRGTPPPVQLPDVPPRAGFGGFRTTPLWQWGSLRIGDNRIDGDAWYDTLPKLRDLGKHNGGPGPIEERPNYRKGYNAFIDAVIGAIPAVPGPAGPAGEAFPMGVADAREDVPEVLRLLRMRVDD
jgi:hypothetical protein